MYAVAMAQGESHGKLAVVLVEMTYVTMTAGIYAGMQQRALRLGSRFMGNLVIVLGVPGLAQCVDWLVHRAAGAAAPGKATLAVCVFTAASALFHLHVMRRGAFLTGESGRTLAEDFRQMPGLLAGFVLKPVAVSRALVERTRRVQDGEAAA